MHTLTRPTVEHLVALADRCYRDHTEQTSVLYRAIAAVGRPASSAR